MVFYWDFGYCLVFFYVVYGLKFICCWGRGFVFRCSLIGFLDIFINKFFFVSFLIYIFNLKGKFNNNDNGGDEFYIYVFIKCESYVKFFVDVKEN